MAYKTIKLTEKHIKLIKGLSFEAYSERVGGLTQNLAWGIDNFSPWGGSYPIEDIALILGKWQEFIPGTEDNPLGRRYPAELEEEFLALYHDIVDNMEFVLSLLTFYADSGLKPGTYKCNPRQKNWTYTED